MGKIRVKTFDESGLLQEDDKKKAKYEAKKAAKAAARLDSPEAKLAKQAEAPAVSETPIAKSTTTPEVTAHAVEETMPVESPAEELASTADAIQAETETVSEAPKAQTSEKKQKKEKFVTKHADSKRHAGNEKLVDKNKAYPLTKALDHLKEFKKSKFDETVELHINVAEKGVSGQVVLPHGTGKSLRIKVADDALIEEVSSGKITFDVLVATPDMMPKLARVAKVLGPRGLMPNPKAGTVTPNPEAAIEKLSAGQVNYKTEAQAPVIHMSVGKVSFENGKLEENIKTVFSSIGTSKINQAILKSTMSPAIKVSVK
jgi:large subunit ribosomal protein L1